MKKVDTISLKDRLDACPGFSIVMHLIIRYPSLRFYLAGGAIRNYLLSPGNFQFKDLDIFINGEGFASFKKEISEYGIAGSTPFGSLRWESDISKGITYDIIHFSEMAVLDKKPNSIIELLNQFDITINAMAIDLREYNFFDPLNGETDLQNHIIKAVRYDFKDEYISTECTISPLSTLWFRILHYASKYNFEIEKDTLTWIKENSFRYQFLHIFKKYFFDPNLNSMKLYDI